MKILGIIPARKGSKGIPNKCLRPLCGKPLLQWTLDAAEDSNLIDDVVLTTDYDRDELHDAVGFKYKRGKCLIINRPAYLCDDKARGADVALHAIWSLGIEYDAVAYLQPTCPLRTAEHIDWYISQLGPRACTYTVASVGGWRPERMHFSPDGSFVGGSVCQEPEFGTNRQDLPECTIRSGSFYFSTVERLVATRSLEGKFCAIREYDELNWVNIDDERDWILAEALMQRRLAGDWKQRPGNDQTARVNENGHLENADGRLLPLEGIDAG